MILSPREREVLILAIQGHIIGQIAGKLAISKHTVRTYRKRIMDKLRADSMELVILRAHHFDIIDLDSIPDVFVASKSD